MTDSPKPVFGSNLFSQSGFGTQSSGGFSGGSFSTQGGSVAASGFGFGASSPSGKQNNNLHLLSFSGFFVEYLLHNCYM